LTEGGKKDAELFKSVMEKATKYIGQTREFSFFQMGRDAMVTLYLSYAPSCGRKTRTPRITLPKGVRVRIKNKGIQKHKKGQNVQNTKLRSGNTLTGK